ncbi:MAG TPA: histidine kinase [Chryseosolibacter sp.]|nr:histidine kinase [Chryseosolibacter sp.]
MVSLHLLVWAAVLGLPYLLISPDSHYANPLCDYFTLSNLTHIALFYLNANFLYQHFFNSTRWWIYMLSLVSLILIVYHSKLWMTQQWFPALSDRQNIFGITFFPVIFCLVISTLYALVADKFKAEKAKLSAELRFLRSQISPHFLFNVHNNLVSMARHKSNLLEPSLIQLSGLMRYMLYEANADKVSLATEIEYLKSYIQLQKIRFEDDIDIKSSIEYHAKGESIEPMLLIPLVENAFKHGVADVDEPFITINLKTDDKILFFDVKNRFSGGRSATDPNAGIGVDNLKARLKLLYPRRHQFSTFAKDGIFHSSLMLKLR